MKLLLIGLLGGVLLATMPVPASGQPEDSSLTRRLDYLESFQVGGPITILEPPEVRLERLESQIINLGGTALDPLEQRLQRLESYHLNRPPLDVPSLIPPLSEMYPDLRPDPGTLH